MGPQSYMRSVVDRNVDMRRMTVVKKTVCTPVYNGVKCSIFYTYFYILRAIQALILSITVLSSDCTIILND